MPRYNMGPCEFVDKYRYRCYLSGKEIKVLEFTDVQINDTTRSQTLTLENGETCEARGLADKPDDPLYIYNTTTHAPHSYVIKRYGKKGKFIQQYSYKRIDPFSDEPPRKKRRLNNNNNINNNRSKQTTVGARDAFRENTDNNNNNNNNNNNKNSSNTNTNTHSNNNNSNTHVPQYEKYYIWTTLVQQNRKKMDNMYKIFKQYQNDRLTRSCLQDMDTAKHYNRFLESRFKRCENIATDLAINGSSNNDISIEYKMVDDVNTMLDDMTMTKHNKCNDNCNSDCNNGIENNKMKNKDDSSNKNTKNLKNIEEQHNKNYCCVCKVNISCVCKKNKKIACDCLKIHWYYMIEFERDPSHVNSQDHKCPFASVCRARIKTFGNKERLKSHITSLHAKDRRETDNISKKCENKICGNKFLVISKGKYKKSKKHVCSNNCSNSLIDCNGEIYVSWKAQRGKHLFRCRRCAQTLTPTEKELEIITNNIKSRDKIQQEATQSEMKCPFCELRVSTNDVGKHIQLAHPQ